MKGATVGDGAPVTALAYDGLPKGGLVMKGEVLVLVASLGTALVGACGGSAITNGNVGDAGGGSSGGSGGGSSGSASSSGGGSSGAATSSGGGSSGAGASSSGGDAGCPACLDAAAPFTPDDIKGKLTFWFDPGSLMQVGGQVTGWTDLTGHGNSAIQTNATYRPAYTAAGIHGLPSATFAAPNTFLRIPDGPQMQWGTSDLLVEIVVRGSAQSAAEAMLYQKTGPSPYDGPSLYLNADKPTATTLAGAQVSGQIYVVSAAPPATFDDGSVHLLGLRRSGVALEVRVDGVVSNSIVNASVGTVDVSSVGADAIIGQNGYGAPSTNEFQQFHGDIAEMIGVKGLLTQTELANVEQYLKTRYGIP